MTGCVQKFLNTIIFLLCATITIVTIVSLSLISQHMTMYRGLLTDQQRDHDEQLFPSYKNSIYAVCALSLVLILSVPAIALAAGKVSKKRFYVCVIAYAAFPFLGLLVALFVFMRGYGVLRESVQRVWKDMYAHRQDACQDSESDLLKCAYSYTFVIAQRAATAHIVFQFTINPFVIGFLLLKNSHWYQSQFERQQDRDSVHSQDNQSKNGDVNDNTAQNFKGQRQANAKYAENPFEVAPTFK